MSDFQVLRDYPWKLVKLSRYIRCSRCYCQMQEYWTGLGMDLCKQCVASLIASVEEEIMEDE